MDTVLSLLLTAAVGLFVAWPFVRPRRRAAGGEADVSPLEQQKLEAYRAIKEAELDVRMGKLSDEDFGLIQAKYRQQALAAIAALEDAKQSGRIEKKTAAVRRPRRIAFCPACGRKVAPRSNFCGACGRSLREAVA